MFQCNGFRFNEHDTEGGTILQRETFNGLNVGRQKTVTFKSFHVPILYLAQHELRV